MRAHADLHRLLASSYCGLEVDVTDHMTDLCRALSEAVLAPRGVRCETATDAGRLPGRQGEWLALVISELVLNPVKHAFDGDGAGVVRVELRRLADSWLDHDTVVTALGTVNGRAVLVGHSFGAGGLFSFRGPPTPGNGRLSQTAYSPFG